MTQAEEAAEKKYPVYWKDYPKDGIARSELSYDTNKQCREAFIAGAEWMAKQKEQKSAKCIEDSIEFKEGFKTGRETGLRDGQKYVLDNLEDYGLCKSAEWSEEDEDKVVQYLHDRDGGMLWSKATEITRDILDMLRPSWKPSEHQMSMLLAVINDPNNACSASCHLSLKSLYNDLKKL